MNKKYILALTLALVLGIFSFVGCASDESTSSTEKAKEVTMGYQKITAQDAKAIMDNGDYDLILDVRTPEEYAEGFIEGAINLPLDDIELKAGDIIPSKDSRILLYCRSGNRSEQAGRLLEKLGYTNVSDFGGIIDWPY